MLSFHRKHQFEVLKAQNCFEKPLFVCTLLSLLTLCEFDVNAKLNDRFFQIFTKLVFYTRYTNIYFENFQKLTFFREKISIFP